MKHGLGTEALQQSHIGRAQPWDTPLGFLKRHSNALPASGTGRSSRNHTQPHQVAVAAALFDTRCRPALPRQLAYKHDCMLRAEVCIFVSCASSVWHTEMRGASSTAAATTGRGPLSPRAVDIVQGTQKKRNATRAAWRFAKRVLTTLNRCP